METRRQKGNKLPWILTSKTILFFAQKSLLEIIQRNFVLKRKATIEVPINVADDMAINLLPNLIIMQEQESKRDSSRPQKQAQKVNI